MVRNITLVLGIFYLNTSTLFSSEDNKPVNLIAQQLLKGPNNESSAGMLA